MPGLPIAKIKLNAREAQRQYVNGNNLHSEYYITLHNFHMKSRSYWRRAAGRTGTWTDAV